MRIVLKFSVVVLLFVLMAFLVINQARKGHLDKPIQYVVEYYFKLKNINAKINHLKIIGNQIKIDDIEINKNKISLKLENILVSSHFVFDYSESEFLSDIAVDQMIIKEDNKEFFHGKLKIDYDYHLIKDQSDVNMILDEVFYYDQVNKLADLVNGRITLKSNTKSKSTDYSIDALFDGNRVINLQTSQNSGITVSGRAENFPIMIYKPFHYLCPDNKLLIFLNDFIKDGVIESGEISINLTEKDIKEKNYNKDNTHGVAKINSLKLVYNSELPPLSEMQVDVLYSGTLVEFIMNKGNSTDIFLTEGLIRMDWKGQDDTVLVVNAKGKGKVKGLTDFISNNVHTELQKASIDLQKFTGNTSVDINILIPLKPKSKNTYDISAIIPNTDLSIFNDKIFLTKANIVGKYDGDTLKLTGTGKVNGFKSHFDFCQNFTDSTEFDHKLNITTNVALPSNKPEKVGFVSLLNGKAKIDFEYININKIGKITLASDLKELEFYLDKLGIRKQIGETADLVVNGSLISTTNGSFDFKIEGSNGLNIKGKTSVKDDSIETITNNLNHKDTNISAKINSSKDLVDIHIRGKLLDLSNADMMQFLEKERNSGATEMDLAVNKVKLKKDIWLSDLKLSFKCNKVKCYSGNIKASIDSKNVDMQLTEDGEWEQWVITSSDAGALLKGIGIYNDMKSGNMKLIMRTNRKELRAGEIIPITNGKFEFERFILNKTSAITKLISFVSLPGFVGMISGNKNITFSNMRGEFTFQEGSLNIKSCKANGPFFSFTMQGLVNTSSRVVDLKGHVTPALYGLSAAVSIVPIIGRLLAGDKNNAGFVSAPYKIKDSY